jgi:hypothetical protein
LTFSRNQNLFSLTGSDLVSQYSCRATKVSLLPKAPAFVIMGRRSMRPPISVPCTMPGTISPPSRIPLAPMAFRTAFAVSPPVRNKLTGLVSLKTDATKNPNPSTICSAVQGRDFCSTSPAPNSGNATLTIRLFSDSKELAFWVPKRSALRLVESAKRLGRRVIVS